MAKPIMLLDQLNFFHRHLRRLPRRVLADVALLQDNSAELSDESLIEAITSSEILEPLEVGKLESIMLRVDARKYVDPWGEASTRFVGEGAVKFSGSGILWRAPTGQPHLYMERGIVNMTTLRIQLGERSKEIEPIEARLREQVDYYRRVVRGHDYEVARYNDIMAGRMPELVKAVKKRLLKRP